MIDYSKMISTATLKDWRVERVGNSLMFFGNCYGDTKGRFPDGYPIHTSGVVSVDMTGGLVVTRNSVYQLEGFAP